MIAQRYLAGDEIVEIIVGALAAARHRFPLADELGRIEALRGAVIRKDIGIIGVEFVVQPARAGTAAIVIPVAGERLGAVVIAIVRPGILRLMSILLIFAFATFSDRLAVIRRKFEQRVLLHFHGDELVEFEMSHLQQLDGLHQLRCHHQGLGLAQEKIGGQCHDGRETPLDSSGKPRPIKASGHGNPSWPKNCFFIVFGQAELCRQGEFLRAARYQRLKLSPR